MQLSPIGTPNNGTLLCSFLPRRGMPRGQAKTLYNLPAMSLNTRLLAVASICLSLAAVTHAEPVSQLRPTDYVNDFAHVLDQNAIVPLDDICRQIDEKAHAQIAVVTINSLDGSDIESYAVDLFKK